MKPDSRRRGVLRMTLVALFAAIAFVLTKFPQIPLPIFPQFLKFEFSELPVILVGLMLGPVAAALTELVKNLIDLLVNPVGMGVGQLANFCIGTSFVVPLLLIYRKKRTAPRFVLSALVGLVVVISVGCVLNAFVLTPLYARAYGAPIEAFVGMAAAVNGFVTDYRSYIFFAIAPFNFLKFTACAIIAYPVTLALKPILRRFS